MSALPQAVQKHVDRANELARQIKEGTLQVNQPPADPAAAAVAPVAPLAAVAPAATPAEPEAWEQKYKVLQGKYNAEVPRLQTQVREQTEVLKEMRQQLSATQTLLASLSAQRTADAAPKPAASAAPARLVTDQEVKEFGPDLIDLSRRIAREELASVLPEIDRRVAPVAAQVQRVGAAAENLGARVARNSYEAMLDLLSSQVPTWLELNSDEGFLTWLDEVDPFAGRIRGDMLSEAYKAHDGPRVVAFFNGYLKEHAAVSPPATPTPAVVPQATPPRTLEQLVVPGTPKPAAASTQTGSNKRVWTRAEIGNFYALVSAGKYPGTAEERKRDEADIFAAQREGRIR